jgi:hypothetical protein
MTPEEKKIGPIEQKKVDILQETIEYAMLFRHAAMKAKDALESGQADRFRSTWGAEAKRLSMSLTRALARYRRNEL